MDLQIEVTNLQEVLAQLKKLDDKLKRKMMIKGIRRAAQPMLKEARNQAPIGKNTHKGKKGVVNPGNLKRSIAMRTGKDKLNPTLWLGANMKRGVDAFYHHIIIGGSKPHKIKVAKGSRALKLGTSGNYAREVNHPGISKNDFIQRAFNVKKSIFVSQLATELDKQIKKELHK